MVEQSIQEEYKELNTNHRFYANMRFAQLTLFSAITAALLTATFTVDPELDYPIRNALKIGGAFTTLVLGIMEWRSTGYGAKFLNRMKELEKSLGYKQWTGRKSGWRAIISSTSAVFSLYLVAFAFWMLSIFCGW